jgi:hypothetical protein
MRSAGRVTQGFPRGVTGVTGVTLAAMALLGLSACGSSAPGSAPSGSSPVSTLAQSPTTSTSQSGGVPTSPAALAALLIDEVPAGYVRQSDADFGTGPQSLAQAATDDGSSGAKAALISSHYLRGYQRLWQAKSGAQILVILNQFQSPTGVSSYIKRAETTFKAHPLVHLKTFTSSGLGTGFTFTEGKNSFGLMFIAAGPIFAIIHVSAPGAVNLEDEVVSVARKQYARL